MIQTLELTNFRGFETYKLNSLKQVNLLVGKNNSGKTSILEALYLLFNSNDPSALYSTLVRRGEEIAEYSDLNRSREVDVCRLFNGFQFEIGAFFEIRGGRGRKIHVEICEAPEAFPQQELLFEPGSGDSLIPLVMRITTTDANGTSELDWPLSTEGGLTYEAIRPRKRRTASHTAPVKLVTTASLEDEDVIYLFDEFVLTEEEDNVIDALRIIDPDIQRIATTANIRRKYNRSQYARSGLVLRKKGINERIPIGSMGDGVWRLLGLILSLIGAKGGVLLIDEIDTGLHYSTMREMWDMVLQTAKRLKVQVFATTHSKDCVTALADLLEDDGKQWNNKVSLHRIDPDSSRSVVFSGEEIIVAAEENIEVR